MTVQQFSNAINHNVVKRLVHSWPKRAGVRHGDYKQPNNNYDENIPDYPVEILPFYQHPKFSNATHQQKQKILTWAWLIYNERVIIAEERVANPAFQMVIQGTFPGANEFHIKQALHQCLIDEHFHSLLHLTAIHETKRLRSINSHVQQCPHSIIFRKLVEAQNQVSEKWKKNLLTLLWTVVSEISINAYLELLSTNKNIQPMHKMVTWLHNRDEYAHGKIVVEICKMVYEKLTPKQKAFFIKGLSKALTAFTSHDFSAWPVILNEVGLRNSAKIIKDCEMNLVNTKLMRDLSGLKKLAEEINIINQLDFEF